MIQFPEDHVLRHGGSMTISDGPCDFSSEFRLGLVLYGGVSLAVYENGVSQEFFRAVKGQGVYTLLMIVDIVSGTSAGGINGIMLGYALAITTATSCRRPSCGGCMET